MSSPPPSADSFDSSIAAANELFVAEDYESAAPLYDAALQQQPNNTAALIARAANSIKRKQYKAALSDADAALAVDSTSHLALYRRATALFYLDDFSAALSAFRDAERGGNKQSALFIRKCEAEIARQKPNTAVPTTTAAVAPTAAAPAPSQPPAASASASATATTASGSGSGTAQPLASRVSESWFQTRQSVTITLFAKNLSKDAVSVRVDESAPHLLSARVQLPDGSLFDKQWSLFAPLHPHTTKVDITAYRVEIIAAKQREEEWPGLLDTDRKRVEGVVKRDNVVRAEAVSAYPTSAKKKVEWNEVETEAAKAEEEEKPQGDAALQKLFQTIYKDANEDTRRAMIKSFQTSGGTVLSTNWKEVAGTDYTKSREAPNGMEMKDWNNPT